MVDVNFEKPVGLFHFHNALRQSGLNHEALYVALSVEVLGIDIIAAFTIPF